MTQISWHFTISREGEVFMIGTLSTSDLSFPARKFEEMGIENAPCTIKVRTAYGEVYEKDWE